MIATPYYLIDKSCLLHNLKIIAKLRKLSGVKILLALKCFAAWSVFDFMRDFMDGTTSSSLFELRLGKEEFNKETHAYSVAFADHEIQEIVQYADKIIFNSLGQLRYFQSRTSNLQKGLRLNPQVSASAFDLADPARPFSRLGEYDPQRIEESLDTVSGFMIHNNCENTDFFLFSQILGEVEKKFSFFFKKIQWISLGGGIHFTEKGYPIDFLADRLKKISDTYGVTVYLEPGEAAVSHSTTLEVSILDCLKNDKELVIVDSSIETHMPDLLIYQENAYLAQSESEGPYEIMVCGKSCLAGDIFGTFRFSSRPRIGDRLSFQDAAGYTMVKKNWFNGISMPSIVIKELDGTTRIVKSFDYYDYRSSLS